MNTYWPCGAASFAFSLLHEATHRIVSIRKGWRCLALCLGIGVLSAANIRGVEAVLVQSVNDLLTLSDRAIKQDRLIVVFFTDLSGKCTNCARMESSLIQNREFMNWMDRRAVFGIVDVSAQKEIQVGRQTLNVENLPIKQVLHSAKARVVPSVALYEASGKQIEYARLGDKP